MTHIVLLLYLLSGFSGIGSLIYIVVTYGRTSPFMKSYIRVHLSYTLLMITALIILYLRVNVIESSWVMSFFIIAILLGQSLLCWALSRFSFVINSRGVTRTTRLVWNIVPFFYVFLAALQYYLKDSRYSLYPVVAGFTLFLFISVYFMVRNSKNNERKKGENRVWIYFFISILIVIGLELFLKFRYGFLGEYTINIPLIFLSWNFLTLSTFKGDTQSRDPQGIPSIAQAKIDLWQLTERELVVTRAIMRGDSNKEIASDLEISFSTVKNHIYNIYRKTGARSRIELANMCSGNNYP